MVIPSTRVGLAAVERVNRRGCTLSCNSQLFTFQRGCETLALSALASSPCGAGEKHTAHPEPVKPGGVLFPRILTHPVFLTALTAFQVLHTPPKSPVTLTTIFYRPTRDDSPNSAGSVSSRLRSRRSGVTPTTAVQMSRSGRVGADFRRVRHASWRVAPVVRTSSITISTRACDGIRPGAQVKDPRTLATR